MNNKKNKWIIFFSIIAIQVITLLIWQYYDYSKQPQVIEVLPVTSFRQSPYIAVNYPEPVRVVFDKPFKKQDFDVMISPEAKVQTYSKAVLPRTNTESTHTMYPALRVMLQEPLQPKTTYTVNIKKRKWNIFNYLFSKSISVTFTTTSEHIPENVLKNSQ